MKLLAPIDDVGDIGFPKVTYITGDLTATNTTYADATGMVVPVAASARYIVECFMVYNAHVDRDIKVQWTVPSGGTGWWSPKCVEAGATNNGGTTGDYNVQSVVWTQGHAMTGGGAIDCFAAPVGHFISSAAGNLQMQWALFSTAAGSGNGTIRAGSMIRYTRLA